MIFRTSFPCAQAFTARCELCRCFTVALFVFRRVPASTLYISVVNAVVNHQSAARSSPPNAIRADLADANSVKEQVQSAMAYKQRTGFIHSALCENNIFKVTRTNIFCFTYKTKSKKVKFLVMRVNVCDTIRYASI